jgi:hypothetical protein
MHNHVRKVRSLSWLCAAVALASFLLTFKAFSQDRQGGHDAWDVVAGSVVEIDQERHTISVLVRGVSESTKASSATNGWTKDSHFASDALQLKGRPEPTRIVFTYGPGLKVFGITGSKLIAESESSIKQSAPVVIQLRNGQYWTGKEGSPGLVAERILLLQACIEESCVRPNCKGACKEKTCDCKGSK